MKPTEGQPLVVVITGASSGIGRATARAFARQGAKLVLAARSAVSLAEVEAECLADGGEALAVPTDVGVGNEVDALLGAAVERFGRVDVVVHSAASIGYGRFEDIPPEVFDRAVQTNLIGTANIARAALHQFKAAGGHGHLVLISSLLAKVPVPFMSTYIAGKWGAHALGRILQVEARETPGIEVSMISPGSVDTPAYQQAANYVGRQGRPPPPIYRPETVAKAILAAVDKKRRDRNVGIANALIVLGYRAVPALYDRLVLPLAKIGALSRKQVASGPGNVLEPVPEGDAATGGWK